VTTVSFSDLSGLCFKIFPLILFCFVSYLVYKSYYFTPRSFAFKDLFPVTDYQSRYYFAPHLILLLTGIQLAILNSFRSYLAGLMALLAITGISWIMFLRDERSTTSSVVSSVCLPAPSAVYAVANDDGFAYYTRLPIVVLDGLVTGHRISDGASYLESMQSQSVHSYITALKVRYLKLGAEKHLNFLAAPGTNERFSKEGRVVSLCGMGEWIELRREDLSAS
jgi:hypothetical protein